MKNIRRSSVCVLCAIAALCAFLLQPQLVSAGPPHKTQVFILHSYNKGYVWTDKIGEGIEDTLRSSLPDLEIHTEYMDTKRTSDEQHFNNLYRTFKHKYGKKRFDVVITSDDHAFQFTLRHGKELFPGMPVIFNGVNNFNDVMFDTSVLAGHRDLFTGVVEDVDIKKTLEAALAFHPKTRQVVVIVDTSGVGKALHEQTVTAASSLGRPVDLVFYEDMGIHEITEKVRRLPRDSIVLFLVFFRDKFGEVFTHDESFRMVQRNASVPLYTCWDIYNGLGGVVGGMLTNGYSQGENAAKLALRVLQGEKPSSIPIVMKSPNRYLFDYQELKRFGIDPSRLPAGSVIFNKPFSFYEENKTAIRGVSVFIAVQTAIIVLLLVNIRRRRRAENALQASESRFRRLLESVQLVALMLDREGTITFCNDYLLQVTGWSRDEVLSKNWFESFLPPDIRNTTRSFFERSVAEASGPFYYENPIVTRGGARRLIVWDNSILRDEEGAVIGTASIGRDVTEHRRLEEQLRQSQKMEAVGQLAGGIAHDFNNILAAITGYASLLKKKLEGDEPLFGFAERILLSADRAAGLTHSLLAFSRKQAVNLRPLNINEIILGFREMLSRLIGEDIEFKLDLSANCMVTNADRGQIEQVLMNLATNARDAMPRGGSLVVRTNPLVVEGSAMKVYNIGVPGAYAAITVADTGFGMDKSTLERIFEPFFTTKEVGKGTGLGLSIIYGIIQKHSGYVAAYSEPGRGTTFKIYLPLIATETKDEARAETGAPPSGSETILLIEDDRNVRQITRVVLEEFGYTVLEAVDGVEALAVYSGKGDSIHLVLSDVIMPGKNGREVAAEIREKFNPCAKIIFVSGYASDTISRAGGPDTGEHFLSKPIHPDELLKKVREVLDN
jgi:PAS domain S-box-containing protein